MEPCSPELDKHSIYTEGHNFVVFTGNLASTHITCEVQIIITKSMTRKIALLDFGHPDFSKIIMHAVFTDTLTKQFGLSYQMFWRKHGCLFQESSSNSKASEWFSTNVEPPITPCKLHQA